MWGGAETNVRKTQVISSLGRQSSSRRSESLDETNLNYRQPLFKPGAWMPVYIDVLNTGKYDERADGPAEVIVETLDSDVE